LSAFTTCSPRRYSHPISFFFFFTDPPPTHTSPLSLHDALPIYIATIFTAGHSRRNRPIVCSPPCPGMKMSTITTSAARRRCRDRDRKSTRLNSSHLGISYAVFCLKKKKKKRTHTNVTKHQIERL